MHKVHFSSKSILWETPQDFFDLLDKEHHFNIDVCAVEENTKCDQYFSPEENGLIQEWTGTCWMNPPYGRNQTNKWVEKAYLESQRGCTVVALLPARTDTRWFHSFIYQKEGVSVNFIKGRLKFGNSKNAAPFPSMVVVFRRRA